MPARAGRFFDGAGPPTSQVPALDGTTRKRQRATSPVDLAAPDTGISRDGAEPWVLADGFVLRAYATASGSIGVQSGERVRLHFEGAQAKKGKRQRAATAAYAAANASVVRVATRTGRTVRARSDAASPPRRLTAPLPSSRASTGSTAP